MPNFKENDGFSLGGNPFTMNQGSKESTTVGCFRQESTDKMGSYDSPFFAIKSSRSETSLYDAPADGGRSGMAAAVDEGRADGKKIAAGLEGDDAGAGEDGLEVAEKEVGMDDSSKESTIGGGGEQEIVNPEVMEEDDDEDY